MFQLKTYLSITIKSKLKIEDDNYDNSINLAKYKVINKKIKKNLHDFTHQKKS